MPAPNVQLEYKGNDKPTLPYISNASPVDDSAHLIPGSINALATVTGWLEKRPGFSAAVEQAISSVPGKIVRMFYWKRWATSLTNPNCYFLMLGTQLTATSTAVYALNLGNGLTGLGAIAPQASFALLFTDSLTDVPFDFVTYQNFVLFGNASTQQNMRKWDGSGITTQWGLFPPISEPDLALVSGELPPNLMFNGSEIIGTPTAAQSSNVTVTVTDATGISATQVYTLTVVPAGVAWTTPAGALMYGFAGSSYLGALNAQSGVTPYTFTVYSGSLPPGMNLASNGYLLGTPTTPGLYSFALKVADSTSPTPAFALRAFSLFIGSSAISIAYDGSGATVSTGTSYSQTASASGGTAPYTFAVVANSASTLPPGLSINSTTGVISGTPTTPAAYSFIIRATDSAGLSSEATFTVTVTSTALTISSSALPNAQVGVSYNRQIQVVGGTTPYTFTFTVGGLTAQTGYNYGYTYVSVSAHESAMSPLSDSTGLFTDQNVGLSVIQSDDPQVQFINIYRTTDGGAQNPAIMRLVTTLPNATQGYEDSTPDIFLGNQTGPGLYLNAPPQPLRGFIVSNGRIWGFKDAATWFTGNEEIINGSPFECMSNAKDGNFYIWPSEVGAITTTPNGVDIALSEEWWQITGDTLDTFRKSHLLTGGGTTSPTCVCTVGSVVYWVDTGMQLWSSSVGEFGKDIRPDLMGLDLSQTFLAYHKYQKRNWLCLLDALNGKLFVYDMDLGQWQTPWTVAATCIVSGQSASNTIALTCAFVNGHTCTLTNGTFQDDGAVYADELRRGLQSIVPGSGTSARNSSEVRQANQFELELNTSVLTDGNGNITEYRPNAPDAVYLLKDDDPIALPLANWIQINDGPQTLQFDSTSQDHVALAQRRWVIEGPAFARRVAWAAVWNAAEIPWRLYGFDVAVKS